MDITNPVPLTNTRLASFSVGQQSFPEAHGLIREALLFEFQQLSLTVASMIADGDPVWDREVIVNKRRGVFKMLEMLDGVLYPMSSAQLHPASVLINGNELSKDSVEVLRHALTATKQYKVRGNTAVKIINLILELIKVIPEQKMEASPS